MCAEAFCLLRLPASRSDSLWGGDAALRCRAPEIADALETPTIVIGGKRLRGSVRLVLTGAARGVGGEEATQYRE